MINTLSKADIKYMNKMVHQMDNYDKNTVDLFFNKVNNTLKKMSDEELNNFYDFYIMNIKNSFAKATDKEAFAMIKKAERKAKINKYKDGFLLLYNNISKRLYKSDKAVIKTVAELSFVYLLFMIFLIYIGTPIVGFEKFANIMMMSVGSYFISRIMCRGGKKEDIKLCTTVQKITMMFLKISFFIGLGDFAMKYIFFKSIYDLIKGFISIGNKLYSVILKA